MDNENFVYEQAIAELENIVNRLNSGACNLDESLQLYTRGVELSKLCEAKISEVETMISMVNPQTGEQTPMPQSVNGNNIFQ